MRKKEEVFEIDVTNLDISKFEEKLEIESVEFCTANAGAKRDIYAGGLFFLNVFIYKFEEKWGSITDCDEEGGSKLLECRETSMRVSCYFLMFLFEEERASIGDCDKVNEQVK